MNGERPGQRVMTEYIRDYRTAESMPQWMQGDIAVKVCEEYGSDGLIDLARKVGKSLRTVQRRLTVAEAYPAGSRRLDIPWSVHARLAGQPDRMDLLDNPPAGGWTDSKAATLVTQRNLERAAVQNTEPGGEVTMIGGHAYRRGTSRHQSWTQQLARGAANADDADDRNNAMSWRWGK